MEHNVEHGEEEAFQDALEAFPSDDDGDPRQHCPDISASATRSEEVCMQQLEGPQQQQQEQPQQQQVEQPLVEGVDSRQQRPDSLSCSAKAAARQEPAAVLTAVQLAPAAAMQSAVQRSPTAADWLLHRAAFAGDVAALQSALAGISKEQLRALDPQGNSALHVAVLRRHRRCVDSLLEAGLPAGLRNGRGWGAVYQAVEMRDRDLALLLLRADVAHVKADVKSKKQAVLKKLWELPDFSTQLHWQLSSTVPGVGMLLSRYAPHDTYTIWKQGCQIRVDGSLMGVREGGQSLLPEWKRGHFSLLYNGSGGGENGKPLAAFVNWTKKKWVDLQAARKRMGTVQDSMLERQVDELMAEPEIMMKKVKASGFKFAPVAGWLTKEVTEKVEGWDTKVYEASGGMIAETKYKARCDVPADMGWEQYLALVLADDVCEQEVLNPMSSKAFSDKQQTGPDKERRRPSAGSMGRNGTKPASEEGAGVTSGSQVSSSGQMDKAGITGAGDMHAGSSADAGSKDKTKPIKKVTGKCWMAAGFPLSLQQLLPLLDVIGSANKHIAKVSKFLSKYGSMDRFPVKIQVPIVFTLYALIQFKKFKLASVEPSKQSSFFKRKESAGAGGSSSSSSNDKAALPADFFEVPADFEKYEPKIFSKVQEHVRAESEGDDIDL